MSLSPDPLDQMLEAEKRRDVDAARARGARLYTLAFSIVTELTASGYLPSRWSGPARVITFSVLADHLFGNAAIEIPRGLAADDAAKGL